MNFGYGFSAKNALAGGLTLPRKGLIAKWTRQYVRGLNDLTQAEIDALTQEQIDALTMDGYWGFVDSIGGSSITLITGNVDDLISASWLFPDNSTTRQIDTLLGGDALFDSTDGMTPFTRYGYEWASLDNSNYLFIGYNGIAGYIESKIAKLSVISRVLLLPTIMIDNLVLFDTIRMVR